MRFCRLTFVLAALSVAAISSDLPAWAGEPPGDAPPAQARLGAIRGRVEIRRAPAAGAARPNVAAIGGSTVDHGGGRRPAVVFLESAPRGAFEGDNERDTPRARMDQRNETFVPHVLAITVGTTVDFPNSDPVFHNVFSLSKTRSFDLGRYPAGRSKAVRFDRPGVVQVFCEIHSHMSAYILVFSHRFFSVTDDEGGYRIDQVPPGTGALVLAYEGNVRESRTVVVTDAAAVVAGFVVR